jgi:predicted MFS family arabinose efflux permease
MNARAPAAATTRVILVLATLHLLAFVDRTALSGVLPLVRGEVAMDDAQAGGLIGTAFALPYAATALGIAAIMRGRRASVGWLAGGVLVWTAAAIASAAATSLVTLSLARALLGIGQGVFVPLAVAWLIDHAGEKRAPALATFASGATIGRSIALLLVGTLLWLLALTLAQTHVAHWRWLLALTAVPNLLILPLLLRASPAAVTAPLIEGEAPAPWPALAIIFAVAIAPLILAQAAGGWMPTLFVRQAGMTAAQAATLLGLVSLATGWVGQAACGWLLARRSALIAHLPLIVLVALAATLIPFSLLTQARALPAMVACVVAANLLLGVSSFAGLFGVQALIPPAARASVNGIYFALVTLIAVGSGPLLAGLLAESGLPIAAALLGTGMIATLACAAAVGAGRATLRAGLRSGGSGIVPLAGR